MSDKDTTLLPRPYPTISKNPNNSSVSNSVKLQIFVLHLGTSLDVDVFFNPADCICFSLEELRSEYSP